MMGASVHAYWPGITEPQVEEQPGFYNDCQAWGDWMAEREGDPVVKQAIEELGAVAIWTYTTEGLADSDVYWVTPRELQEAARRLRVAVQETQPRVVPILETYARHANRVDPIAEQFMQDLLDIDTLAGWAEEEQHTPYMTLAVNW